MSTHVMPMAERPMHITTRDCRCRPVEQSIIGDDDVITWVIKHHELTDLASAAETSPQVTAPEGASLQVRGVGGTSPLGGAAHRENAGVEAPYGSGRSGPGPH